MWQVKESKHGYMKELKKSKKITIKLLVATSLNNVIGTPDGKLPWSITEDLKLFKEITLGHDIVMGRKTFESVGFKGLPNRRNLILTSNKDYVNNGNVMFFDSAENILNSVVKGNTLFICGGQQVYDLFLPIADEIYKTIVYMKYNEDNCAMFPELNENDWENLGSRKITDQAKQFFYKRM